MDKVYPKNIAIIMDGNRRWALNNRLPIYSGHKYGAKNLNKILNKCLSLKISELTVFAFSTENWSRPYSEVNGLMKLMEMFIKSETALLNSNNIVLKLIGNVDCFNKNLLDVLRNAEELTRNNTGLKLNVALNYGGRQDITYSLKTLCTEIIENRLSLKDITEEKIRENLNSSLVSDFDLLIRTGGEKRISNFMFWQLTYSELFFTDTLWPDFSEKEFESIIYDYLNRDRRFGKLMSKKYV